MAHFTSLSISLLIFLAVEYLLLTTFYRDEEANRRPEPLKNHQLWPGSSSAPTSRIWPGNPSAPTSRLSSSTKGAVAVTADQTVFRGTSSTPTQPTRKKVEKKKILFYTNFFSQIYWGFGTGDKVFQEKGCPISDCIITNNRNMFGDISGEIVVG